MAAMAWHPPVEVHGGGHGLADPPLLLDGGDLLVGEPERPEEQLQQLARQDVHLLVELLHHVAVGNRHRPTAGVSTTTRW
jgi:hypothetical protein